MKDKGFPALKQFRLNMKMSQKDFANSIGLNLSTYNNYETGAREPNSDFWIAISKKYNISVDTLLGLNKKLPVTERTGDKDIFLDELMHNYKALNREGQHKLVDYSKDLVSGGRYAAAVEDVG